jgi:hypothetical protein
MFCSPAWTETWTNYASNDFAGGDGSANSPYMIDSPERLARLSLLVNDGIIDSDGVKFSEKFYILTGNINLEAHEWSSIGGYSKTFNGNFDGNGQVISNMKIPHGIKQAGLTGLFGTVGVVDDEYNADIRIANVRVSDSEVHGLSISAGLIGFLEKGRVENCIVDVSVIGHSGYGNVGGLIAYNGKGEVINCVAKGSVSSIGGSISNVGGLIGENKSGRIINCVARNRISVQTLYSAVGGLVGRNDSEGFIRNSISTGDIEAFKTCKVQTVVGENDGTLEDSVGKGEIKFLVSSSDFSRIY